MGESVTFNASGINSSNVILQRHWPYGFSKTLAFRKTKPDSQPTVWPGVPLSSNPTPLPPPRSTSKEMSVVRNRKPDELEQFISQD